MSIKWMNVGWQSSRTHLENPTKLLVYLALADHANDEGQCYLLVSTIARKARTSERNVSRILSEFVRHGVIVRDQRYKQSSIFTLLPERSWGDRLSGQILG